MRQVLAGLGMALLALPAAAQTTDTNASSQSAAYTQVITGGGSSDSRIEYGGSYTARTVPDAIAPMVPGGANPCVVGMSASGSVVGFGASMGGTWSDPDCERRNLAIILLNAGNQFGDTALSNAGIEVLCANEDVAIALEVSGRPCRRPSVRDQQTAEAPSARNDFDWIERSGR